MPELEKDSRFPSGLWRGYLRQRFFGRDGRYPTEMSLTFMEGHVSGEGRDDAGAFTILGRYSPSDGKCSWTKRYSRYSAAWQGINEGRGIKGSWELSPLFGFKRGGGAFHIWPESMPEPEEAKLVAPDLPAAGRVKTAIGVILCLVVGALVAFLEEYLRRRFR